MPLQECEINGESGWRWGDAGKCYTGDDAKKRAIDQGLAEGDGKLTKLERAALLRTVAEDDLIQLLADGEERNPTYAVLKSNDEMRYTLGVVYVPGQLDAHDEYTTDDDLHKAVIDYMLNSDRRLTLQHDTSVRCASVPEMIRWPYETTVQLSLADGTSRAVTLPAGTVYAGVIWDEEYWPDVKKGKIGGLSLGGQALRVAEEQDTPTTRMGN